MDREEWNRKHGEAGVLFGTEPNRFLVAEVEGLAGALQAPRFSGRAAPARPAALPAEARALDLACGAGRNAVWLARRGWRVTGVDFSDVALRNARALAAEREVEVEWVQADVRSWEPALLAFDLVVILYLQLPAAERRLVLGRAAAAVAPGGTLLVVGHHLQNLDGGHGGPKDPAVLLTPEQVAAELPGLEIEKAERVLRPVETEDGEVYAIDALVRATR
jgi:2-polyprenyl-3-methyl-5-hydroxy-6-metoxy-1,4-benzoquinol methylase